MKYFVSEIFASLQGEGARCGMRSCFIRFHYCHLTCKWCDSKYTWHTKSGVFGQQDAQQIKQSIKRFAISNVVLTGGEPCLYSLEHLLMKNFFYQVETSGTIIPTKRVSLTLADGHVVERPPMPRGYVKRFEWIVSPKLKSAAQKITPATVEALHYFARLKNAWFKFVVVDVESDLKQIDDIVKDYAIDKERVFISLEGNSRESQLQSEAVEKLLAHYHYSPRLQTLLWPKERRR